jgi:predicted transposase YbfD/YdcC
MEIEVDFEKLKAIFESLPDPRVIGRTSHKLVEILFLTLCAVLCGMEDWEAIEDWGNEKLDWLRKFVGLENGIPSHDTIGRVFSVLDSVVFQECFMKWMVSLCPALEGQIVAIDGKTMRGSHHRRLGKSAIHMVSAFACGHGLALGQIKTDAKSNEITAIPELVDALDLQGSIVTIDAMGCQKEIAKVVIEKSADYVFGLKGNQGALHEQAEEFFATAAKYDYRGLTAMPYETCEKGHGRIETRRCIALTAAHMENVEAWTGLQSIAMVESTRETGDKRTVEKRFYISSLAPDSKQIAHAIRSHWAIENQLHWCLDVTFNEDPSRIRRDSAPENLNIVKKIAMNLLRINPLKRSLPKKRLKACLNEDYLAEILGVHV